MFGLARHKLIFLRKKQQSTVSKNIIVEDGLNWAAAWPRATAAVTAIVMAVAAAARVAAEEMANAKQTVEAEAKTQQSTIKKQKNGSKDNGRSGGAAVSGGWQRCNGCSGSQGNGRGRWGDGAVGRQRRLQQQSLRSAAVVARCYRPPSQHRRKLEQYQPEQ